MPMLDVFCGWHYPFRKSVIFFIFFSGEGGFSLIFLLRELLLSSFFAPETSKVKTKKTETFYDLDCTQNHVTDIITKCFLSKLFFPFIFTKMHFSGPYSYWNDCQLITVLLFLCQLAYKALLAHTKLKRFWKRQDKRIINNLPLMGNPTINDGEAVYQSIIIIIQIRANKIKTNVCFYLKGKLVNITCESKILQVSEN